MGIVFVHCDAPKVAPLLWETLGVIASSSPVVPADSLQVRSFQCPRGFCSRQLLAKDALLYFGYGPPRGVSQGVGLQAWKANPRAEDKGRLKEETCRLISQAWG